MRSGRVGRWAQLATLACAIVGAFVACTLNPQPIPPGAKASGAAPPPFATGGSNGPDGDLTGIPPLAGDGGAVRDGAMPPQPTLDGGEPFDGDAATDGGAADGSVDAAFDAPLDGVTE